MREAVNYIIQFLLLVLLQVFILNNIAFWGYMNPYPYVIFILMLPVKLNRIALLFVGFSLGLIIDVFENSGGLHASATLLIAFLRPYLFQLFVGNSSAELDKLNSKTIGLLRFMALAGVTVLIHHFWLFLLEAFTLHQLLQVLVRTLVSALFTLFIIYLMQIIVYRKTT